ncbi:MAG: branched-chain amino acid ABC transporter permease [Betaproteobacteria bacterium]|nr:branched-chain amino acid ABC transporter permease [Betaproteobacteria bacterium]
MLATFVLFATLPFWIKGVGLYPYLGVEVMIWIVYALGFNLLLGHAGLPSFGHGAYFGVGAYAFGLTQLHWGLGLGGGLLFAVLAGGIAGALVAAFISHRRGIYYALLTIAFGQIFWFVAVKWHSVTRGEDGLLNIKRGSVLGYPLEALESLYFFCFAVFVVVVLLLWRLVHSPFGRVLSAIRQNETRARFVGYNVWLYKWLAFTLSALIAGAAGGLLALAQQSAYPNVMSLHQSGFVVMMTLVGGGLVSFWGPVLGAVLFFLARDLLGAYTEAWLLWYGLLFMLIVLFKPEGLAGLLTDVRSRPSA